MATDNPQQGVLLIGKSQLVLDDALAGLRDLGYKAEGTNDFGRRDSTVRRERSRPGRVRRSGPAGPQG